MIEEPTILDPVENQDLAFEVKLHALVPVFTYLIRLDLNLGQGLVFVGGWNVLIGYQASDLHFRRLFRGAKVFYFKTYIYII